MSASRKAMPPPPYTPRASVLEAPAYPDTPASQAATQEPPPYDTATPHGVTQDPPHADDPAFQAPPQASAHAVARLDAPGLETTSPDSPRFDTPAPQAAPEAAQRAETPAPDDEEAPAQACPSSPRPSFRRMSEDNTLNHSDDDDDDDSEDFGEDEEPLVGVDDEEGSAVEVKLIPGKGRGIVAARMIPPGTLLIAEDCLFTVHMDSLQLDSPVACNALVAAKVGALTKQQQQHYLTLQNGWPGHGPFWAIFRTNSLPLGPGSGLHGIFLFASLFNNECVAPNCQAIWRTGKRQLTIHTLQAIREGEELTVAYEPLNTYAKRREYLAGSYNFVCQCGHCLQSVPVREASDKRIECILSLEGAVYDSNRHHSNKDPWEHLRWLRALVSLYSQEKIRDERVARAYDIAFQTVAYHGDYNRARQFASLAYRAYVRYEGQTERVTYLHDFSQDPAVCSFFDSTTMMANRKEDYNENMTKAEHNNWLWAVGEGLSTSVQTDQGSHDEETVKSKAAKAKRNARSKAQAKRRAKAKREGADCGAQDVAEGDHDEELQSKSEADAEMAEDMLNASEEAGGSFGDDHETNEINPEDENEDNHVSPEHDTEMSGDNAREG